MLRRFASSLLTRLLCRNRGQSVLEYALVLAAASAATQVALLNLGQRAADVFNAVGGGLDLP
jgi:hypothetical protein